jgi:hypothetical protein
MSSSSSTSTSTSTSSTSQPAPTEAESTGTSAPKQLNFPGAINVLIQGVNIAQSKGIYTLADANLLHQSIQLINQVMVKSFGAQTQAPAKQDDNDDDEDIEDKLQAKATN